MAEINTLVVKLDNEKFQAIVDMQLYAKEVVTAAIYKYSHLFYIFQSIDVNNANLINVVFESKDGNIITEDISKQFCNDLIDQQIRYNTNLQFGHIRDMIVKEAFKPVTLK